MRNLSPTKPSSNRTIRIQGTNSPAQSIPIIRKVYDHTILDLTPVRDTLEKQLRYMGYPLDERDNQFFIGLMEPFIDYLTLESNEQSWINDTYEELLVNFNIPTQVRIQMKAEVNQVMSQCFARAKIQIHAHNNPTLLEMVPLGPYTYQVPLIEKIAVRHSATDKG